METATRILNLCAGVLVLITGVYVLMNFDGMLTDLMRLAISLACVAYFAVQLWRQISMLEPVQTTSKTGDNRLEF